MVLNTLSRCHPNVGTSPPKTLPGRELGILPLALLAKALDSRLRKAHSRDRDRDACSRFIHSPKTPPTFRISILFVMYKFNYCVTLV